MNILIVRKSLIKEHIKIENHGFKTEKRSEDFQLGRFLIRLGAKIFYNITDFEIIYQGKKPVIAGNLFYFSISHSKDIVAVAFDKFNIGLDIEYMKERNFDKIAKYLKINTKNKDEFYQYWTTFEAQYKSSKQHLTTFQLENYMVSVSSAGDINNKLQIYEVVIPKNSTTPNELISLKTVNESNKKESAVELQEINTASLDFLPPLNLNIE